MNIPLEDKLYTSTQVSEILGVSLRTLYRYMEDNKIQSMRTASGRHRFTKDQILDFLNANNMIPEGNYQRGVEYQNRQASVPNSEQPVYGNPYFQQQTQQQSYYPQQNVQSSYNKGQLNQQQQYNPPYGNQVQNPYPVGPDFSKSQEFEDKFKEEDDLGDLYFKKEEKPATQSPTSIPYGQSAYPGDPVTSSQGWGDDEFSSMKGTETKPMSNQPYSDFDMDFEGDFKDQNEETKYPEPEFKAPQPQSTNQYMPQGSNPNVVTGGYVKQDNYDYPPQNRPIPTSGSGISTQPSMQMPVQESYETQDLSADMNIRYYKSDYQDLIELARRIKDVSNSKDLEYAFTLFAGLSLHFLIKPFTVLHFYANPEDMQLWKDELRLTPSQRKDDSNIGIIVNTDIVFVPTKEIGGFKVVQDKILLRDLSNHKEEELFKQFRQYLTSK